MYQKTITADEITLVGGAKVNPIVTMIDDSGSKAHIWVDDSCYVTGWEYDCVVTKGHHIFPEIFDELVKLPNPRTVGSFSASM